MATCPTLSYRRELSGTCIPPGTATICRTWTLCAPSPCSSSYSDIYFITWELQTLARSKPHGWESWVKIFFVHTCFVLMLSLERQWKNQAPTELFSSLMIRRIFRIYPLSLCVVSLIVALRLPLAELNPGRFVAMPHSILA